MRLVVLSLVLLASAAKATPVDSVCPWKLPFQITIHAEGSGYRTHDFVPTHGAATHTQEDFAGQDDHSFVVDTSTWSLSGVTRVVEFSVKSDTLRYREYYDHAPNIGYQYDTTEVTIAFRDSGNSVASIICSEHGIMTQGNSVNERSCAFALLDALYNDTSIYVDDSSYEEHHVSYSSYDANLLYSETIQMPEFGDFTHSWFTARSVSLSGVVRPVTLASRAGVIAGSDTQRLRISGSQPLVAHFASAGSIRTMDIFSAVGTSVGTETIPSGATEVALPRLRPGLYFVRLGQTVDRIAVVR